LIERRVFEVLVGAALDGDRCGWACVEPRAALREEVVAMTQPFAQRREFVVLERVAIDGSLQT
jgi:hypothetical protein